jgi:hypothetical protein
MTTKVSPGVGVVCSLICSHSAAPVAPADSFRIASYFVKYWKLSGMQEYHIFYILQISLYEKIERKPNLLETKIINQKLRTISLKKNWSSV